MSDKGTVLVTGGSGYVGRWLIVGLLARGYRVRTTLRSATREAELRAAIALETKATFEIALADLLSDAGWDAAMAGVNAVFHAASPMRPGPGEDVERSAREGTRRVFEAAARAGVSRIVQTSSVVAAQPGAGTPSPFDETSWTEPTGKAGAYARSKTLAERDAWAMAERLHVPLTTILPGLILGPLLGDDFSESLEIVGRMLRGKMPGSPNLYLGIVDVRDLVELEIRALESADAAGQRFIGVSDAYWIREIAALLRAELGDKAKKAPTRRMPDFVVRLAALLDPPMRQVLPNLGVQRVYTSAKAERVLGWQHRSAKDSILATANSFLQRDATT
jgi:dihydroflavonol-4-reductase